MQVRDQVQMREAVEVGQPGGVRGIELDAALHASRRHRLDGHPLVGRERRAHDADRHERDRVCHVVLALDDHGRGLDDRGRRDRRA